MKPGALAGIMAAGCTAACATTGDPYRVDAVAELVPLATAGVRIDRRIDGPLEVLGTGMPEAGDGFVRTVAAYHVHLPEDAAPWVRLYIASSCTPGDPPMLFEDLGAIRRVGDETHFFARDVMVGDRTLDIDTGTVAADVTLDSSAYGNLFEMIAVVQAPGGGPVIESSSGNPVPAGGPWLACGVFMTP